MRQQTFAADVFESYRKPTRRERFLGEMERVVPWPELCALIAPVYAREPAGAGRRPVGLERMLRIYFIQQWFTLSES
jgi:transposase, IS5 family